MKLLANQVIFVTGATGGIGQAICSVLAENGASVVIGYNQSKKKAEKILEQLAEVPAGHLICPAVVTDSQSLKDAALSVKSKFGKCDILINCAGVTKFVEHQDLESLDDALIDLILTTNIRGVIASIRAFLPLLQQSEKGLILNISSIAARTAMGSNIAYCASKAAVDNLTVSLARALAPKIRVISIAPGLSDTEFVQGLDQEWRDQQAELTPLGRLALPEEVASAVLASAAHLTFTTGTVIPVDGGGLWLLPRLLPPTV